MAGLCEYNDIHMNKSKSPTRKRGLGPKKIAKYLAPGNSRLSALLQQTIAIRTLKVALWPAIPTSLQAHCDVANFRGQTLVLVTHSSVWAAKLRHISPRILHAARKLCKIDAQKIQIKIQPFTVAKPQSTRPRTLPQRTAVHLRDVASGVEDEELKEILLTIATHSN